MGLGEPEEYENTNPLSENTPYFRKYSFEGMEENSTIVTVGYYEGINELYLKICRREGGMGRTGREERFACRWCCVPVAHVRYGPERRPGRAGQIPGVVG